MAVDQHEASLVLAGQEGIGATISEVRPDGNETFVQNGASPQTGETPASRRTMTIPTFLVPLLEEQIGRNNELVFPSRDGTPMRRTNFRRRTWEAALKKAELYTAAAGTVT